ncbi:MAG: metallophosphoesterase [Sedimentisphaerales bacterium]|nr:metallophosphoesterase [Sedimentisphaerales bacterium]
MTQNFIDLLQIGMEANHKDSCRRHNLIVGPDKGDMVIAGDIHGHRRNFERVVNYAALDKNPDRHLILQEIIHGGLEDEQGGCLSFEVLADAVKLKIYYPDRVHFILANHDTAFINNNEVMKGGKEMNAAMRAAMQRRFGDRVFDVESAIEKFLFSQPLAVKTANRIWISHSLPANRMLEKFDFSIFVRKLKINDIVRPNSAYLLTWGRGHSQETLDFMADKLDIDFFVLGHQVQETGWMSNNKNLIIIDSQHNHGHLMHIDLTCQYTIQKLVDSLVPIAGIY